MSDRNQPVRVGSENQKQIQAKFSRPFDVHRWTDHPELVGCLGELQAEIEATEKRTRQRSASDAKKFRDALRCLILDLYVAWKTDPELLVGVSLGKSRFDHKTRYDALYLSYLSFVAAFKGLERLGYLEIVLLGFIDRSQGISRNTKVRATPKLIDLLVGKVRLPLAALTYRNGNDAPEAIVLKDSDKQLLDYDDTPETHQMRADLKVINAGLAQHWIDLMLSDNEHQTLRTELRSSSDTDDNRLPWDITAKQLYRVFNNASWADGGRFYGGWWQSIPSRYRKHITIDGKRTVEIDYSGMHVQMLYAEAGIDPPSSTDSYLIPGLNVDRALVKRTFNKLINATGRMRVDPYYDAQVIGLNWDEFLLRVQDHFGPIKRFLRTGYGVKLQRRDADIANSVMLEFFRRGYVCLPVHDSFLVHHALADELRQLMLMQFRQATGLNIGLKTEWGADQAQSIGLVNHEEALSEMLGLDGEYQGFNSRQYEWELCKSGGYG
jgi:hypothetical protein